MNFEIDNGVLKKYTQDYKTTDVVIPEGVTRIGDRAFCVCTQLTSITIPNSVTSIGDSAFVGCNALANNDGYVVIRDVLYDYNGDENTITLPDNIKSIDDFAFIRSNNMTSITIPASVTTIDGVAFIYCKNLTNITIFDTTLANSNVFGFFAICKNISGLKIISHGIKLDELNSTLESIKFLSPHTNVDVVTQE